MAASPLLRRLVAPIACAVAFVALPATGQLGPRDAFAQPEDPYKRHMENGVKLYTDRNYPAAIIEFEAAYVAKPKANPLVNIALCHKAQFNYPKAIQALEKALRDHGAAMDPGDNKAATDAIKEMKGLLAYVTVKIVPATATLTVDGEDQPKGAADAPIALGPGTHRISASADGYAAQERSITVSSGEKNQGIDLRLVPDKGWVVVQFPNMIIAIDSKPVGQGEYRGMQAPGTHIVQVYTAGKPALSASFLVSAGKYVLIRPGANGAPVVIGQAQPITIPPPPPQLPKKRDRIEDPPPPPSPPKKGFYGLLGGSTLWPTTHASAIRAETDFGGAGGIQVGYRVNNNAGFGLLFQYSNVFVHEHAPITDTGLGYTQSTTRFGGNLRLMTGGSVVRLVGTFGAGFAYDKIDWKTKYTDADGVDPFLMADIGIELDINKVLIDLVFESQIQASRGISHQTFKNDVIGYVGPGLRIGYAFW